MYTLGPPVPNRPGGHGARTGGRHAKPCGEHGSLNALLLGILAYVSLQILFGIYAGRKIHSEEDYLIGGRRIGPWLATFSLFATWFGAETCIGAASQAYTGGLETLAIEPFGYGSCLLLMGVLLAVPLWRMKITTLGDLFRLRYGPGVERLSVLLMVPTSMLWAAAQIRAFGQILAASSTMEVETAVTLAAGVVILYTTVGGFLADAFSDLVQGLVLAAGLVVVFVGYGFAGPSMDVLALPAERLRVVAADVSWLDMAERFAVPVLGSLVAQELVARVCAARSSRLARGASVGAAGLYYVVGLIPVALGLLASQTDLVVDDPEQVLVAIAGSVLPAGLFILFAGALVSAILSTVDSALLVSGALVAHNIVLRIIPVGDEAQKVRVNRFAVVIMGLIAYGLTFSGEGVWGLVLEASGFGSAGLVVAVVFGLYTGFGGPRAATASLLTGVTVYVLGAHVIGIDHPFLTSLAAALIAFVSVGLTEGRAAVRGNRGFVREPMPADG